MYENKEAFRLLMQRIREGSEEAIREFLDLYGPDVLKVVRRRLDRTLRSKYDSTDFTQDVWASFFAHQLDRPFDAPETLVAFLISMARNKVVDGLRQQVAAQKHGAFREQSLDEGKPPMADELCAPQPTPSQVVGAEEEWQLMLEKLTPREKVILTLLRQGYKQREIALKAGVTVRTVRRVIEKLTPRYT